MPHSAVISRGTGMAWQEILLRLHARSAAMAARVDSKRTIRFIRRYGRTTLPALLSVSRMVYMFDTAPTRSLLLTLK